MTITKRQKTQYKAILVDFDGVLRKWSPSENLIENKYGLTQGAIQKVAFGKELLEKAIRGVITDENWRSEMAEYLQACQPDSDAMSAINEWSSSCGEIDGELLSLLSRYKTETDIVLLTNATSRLNDDLVALGLGNWFSKVVNSSDMGSIKPEPEIYQIAIEACNCPMEEIVYIDDSLENILTATELGILSHHYKGVAECGRYLAEIGLPGCSSSADAI